MICCQWLLPYDRDDVWTDDELAFDGSLLTYAWSDYSSLTASRDLSAVGHSGPQAGGQISSVRLRVYAETEHGGESYVVAWDGPLVIGTALGFAKTAAPLGSPAWSAKTLLDEPAGGWNWDKLNNLTYDLYSPIGPAMNLHYKVEIDVLYEQETMVLPGNVNIAPTGIPSEQAVGGIQQLDHTLLVRTIVSEEVVPGNLLATGYIDDNIGAEQFGGYGGNDEDWINPENVFDGSEATYAHYSAPQDRDMGGMGCSIGPLPGTITQVRMRRLWESVGVGSVTGGSNELFYYDYDGFVDYWTISPVPVVSSKEWSDWYVIDASGLPGGTWDAYKLHNLMPIVSLNGVDYEGRIFKVEIEATGTSDLAILPGNVDIEATGLATAAAVGSHNLNRDPSLEPTGVPSGEAIGSPAVHMEILATGLPSEEAVGTHIATAGLTMDTTGIATAEAHGTGLIWIEVTDVGGIATAQAVGDLSIFDSTGHIGASGIPSGEVVPAPRILGGSQYQSSIFTRPFHRPYRDIFRPVFGKRV